MSSNTRGVKVILKHVSISFPARPEGVTVPDNRVLAAYQYWNRNEDLAYAAAMFDKVPPESTVEDILGNLSSLTQYGFTILRASPISRTLAGESFVRVRVSEPGWIQEGVIWIDQRRNQYTFSVSARPGRENSKEFQMEVKRFLGSLDWNYR